MKKLALLLALVMMVTVFAACGGNNAAPSEAAPSESASEPASEEAAPEDAEEEASPEGEVLELPVTIQNSTGVEIYELYASGAGVDTWGDNLLGDATLADGATVDLTFMVDVNNVQWDLMMVDSEGNEVPLYGLDFAECSTDGGNVVLEFDATAGEGTATLYSK